MHRQGAGPARSGPEYHSRIPHRLADLIQGFEEQVESALAAADAARLEEVADGVNRIRIQGQPVPAEGVEIARAGTVAELSREWGARGSVDPRATALRDLLEGRVVAQLFFAGAATRFAKVAGGPLYFLDPWAVAERIREAGASEVPPFAAGLSREQYLRVHQAATESLAARRAPDRIRLPLGPRIILGYRVALERLARSAGMPVQEARRRARFVVHVPETDDGRRITEDIAARQFFGFDPAGFLLVPQPCFGGWRVAARALEDIPGSHGFPYGHGYSTSQLAHAGAARRWVDGEWASVPEDPLQHLGEEGDFLLRTHRVNDLTQLSGASIDLERLAAGRWLVDQGHPVVIELVANPGGQKGGNWVARKGADHRFLIEGMNARTAGWPEFLERHRGAPYNSFRNIYDGAGLRRILLEEALPDHLRIRKTGLSTHPVGLYLESVTGDLTQIPRARAAAFRRDEGEEIHDLKELKDLPDGLRFAEMQDSDEDFRKLAESRGDR